ncbi:MAG: hypothetical protein IPK80_30630 [Nannocystis sp.]|nr:hypothetical protein [Nannocystis sp.]
MPHFSTRRAGLATLVLVGLQGAPSPARALSCGDYFGSYYAFRSGGTFAVDRQVPLDVRPWHYFSCGWSPESCALVAADDVVQLTIERSACTQGAERVVFTPERPLIAGQAYTLACEGLEDDPWDGGGAQASDGAITAVDRPAVAPISLRIADNRLTRDDDGCCSDGGWFALEIDAVLGDAAPDFFREGGRVDISGPDGEVGSVDVEDASWVLPPSEGKHTFTAVAADGARGEPVILPEHNINREAVYIPCAVSSRTTAPLAMLLPFLWLAIGRRRAVRSA